jgi:CRP/FNR family cyclic AMP-dependent transcriptional regulator
MRRARFNGGDRIFSQGDRSDGAFLVIAGAVEIHAEQDGRSYTLAEIGPGGLFGEMGLLDDAPRSATAVAVTDTTCAVYDPNELKRLIRHDPDELLRIMRTLIQRLRDMDRSYVDVLRSINRLPASLSAERNRRDDAGGKPMP